MNKKNYISKLLTIDSGRLKDDHMKYFYTKFPEWCCTTNDPPLFEDIDEYDFLKPIEKLAEYYDNKENSYFTELHKRLKKIKFTKSAVKIHNNPDLDQMMMQYIACRPTCRIITIYPNEKMTETKSLVEEIMKNNVIYGIKKITTTPKLLVNLIYFLYCKTKTFSDVKSIEAFVNKFTGNDIIILVCEIAIKDKIKSDKCHITNEFTQTKELSQIYFNDNSLQFLAKQSLSRFIGFNMRVCRTIVNTFKNFLYQEIHPLDRMRFLTLSGSLLYSYGLRPCSDIDAFIQNYPVSPEFVEKVDHFLLDNETKLPIVDFYMKDNPKSTWKDFWEDWHAEWTKYIGANNFKEVTYDPRFHFYYLGMKFIILDAEMYRRFKRCRVRAYADIIATNEIIGTDYKIPSIPKVMTCEDVEIKVDNIKQLDTIIKGISKALYYRFMIKKTPDEIKELIPNYYDIEKNITTEKPPPPATVAKKATPQATVKKATPKKATPKKATPKKATPKKVKKETVKKADNKEKVKKIKVVKKPIEKKTTTTKKIKIIK